MKNCGFPYGLMHQFATELRLSGQPSVDAFLEQHRSNDDFGRLGKAAIAASLIPQEEELRLTDRTDLKLYEYLWHQMSATPGTYSGNGLSVLTFNYDRSFEQYLRIALRASHPEFRDGGSTFVMAVSQFDIIHLYGSLGHLDAVDGHLPYGGTDIPPLPETILGAAKRIKLYHESKLDDDTLERIRLRIGEAETICFLGFAFHPANIRLLQFCGLGESKKSRYFASAFGVKEGERTSIRALLGFDIKFAPETMTSLDALRTLPVLTAT
jgi:hypothetical protein